MLKVGGIAGLIYLALFIYAVLNISGTPVSTGEKVLWILAILVFPLFGFLAWLALGPGSPLRR